MRGRWRRSRRNDARYLLARAGVAVIVCEKHADFLRDFRGDTVHPSTLEIMHELGLADRLLQLPHQKIERLSGAVGDQTFPFADSRTCQCTIPSLRSCHNGIS